MISRVNMSKMRKLFMSSSTVKSFEDIPGPRSLPVIGTLWNYLPLIGAYRFDKLHDNGLKKFKEFGPVVREEIVPGVNVIWIYSPEDVQELLRKEGRYPQRRSHLALEHYRRSRPDLYNTGGLLPTNGPDWWKLRSVFQKGLSSPRNVRLYLPVVDEVVNEFVCHVQKRVDATSDFLPHLSRVFLEMLGLVAFDTRLNTLSIEELRPSSKTSRLMEAALTTNSCILKTDNGPQLWRYCTTPLYNNLKIAHQVLEEVAVSLVTEKVKKLKELENTEHEPSLLEIYLKAPQIDFKDVVGMSVDMLLAGVDTTTYSTCFALYHLANNLDKQELLFRESMELLPRPDSAVTGQILAESIYLKAVIKESLRLNPISVGVGRVLAEDAIFSGYQVPSGNVVVTQNQVVCRHEKYFRDSLRFIPERWIKSHERHETVSAYLLLPFGHGPRTCIARRLAEQNIQTLVFKLMDEIKEGIQYVFHTSNELTLAVSGSGHAGLEAAMCNLIEPGDKVMVAINGFWARRAEQVAMRHGAIVKTLVADAGRAFKESEIEEAIKEFKPVIFYIVHGESSTGVCQPINHLGKMCRKYGCLFVVDTVASLCGVPIFEDEWLIDCVHSGTQKALGAAPGLAPISFSPNAVKKIRAKKHPIPVFYFDMILVGQYWGCFKDKPRTYHHTVPLNLLYGLREALAHVVEEGIKNCLARHEQAAKSLHKGLAEIGLDLFVTDAAIRLTTVTVVKVPEDINWKQMLQFCRDEFDLEISPGIGQGAGKTVRIGVMGYNANFNTVKYLLNCLKQALLHCRLVKKV